MMSFSAELVLGIVAIASLMWLAIANFVSWIRIRREGIITEAVVVSKQTGRTKFITYRYEFTRDGKQVLREQSRQVHDKTFHAVSEGSKVSIRYSPSNPQKSVLVDDNHEIYTIGCSFLLILMIGILIVGSVM